MSLRQDAIQIWSAGVAAVDSSRLVQQQIDVHNGILRLGSFQIELNQIRHLEVVGAGKAGAGMAEGVVAALKPFQVPFTVSGWVNVPADCVRDIPGIRLHAARPAGVNEPAAEGVLGTAEILRRVSSLTTRDVCLVLISGGGSALLCQPIPEISLADKTEITRLLSRDGAPIDELNCVRTQLSLVKGGRLANACTAGTLIAMIISDVIGDPLPIIASGPTVSSMATEADALQILKRRGLTDGRAPRSVVEYLSRKAAPDLQSAEKPPRPTESAGSLLANPSAWTGPPATKQAFPGRVYNQIIGSNRTALDAAAEMARKLGFEVVSLGSDNQMTAKKEGQLILEQMLQLQSGLVPSGKSAQRGICLLSGGEPTVRLAPSDQTRKGGRNQELVLSAVSMRSHPEDWNHLVLLSGGTDGEDGPTDAAGAVADEELVRRMKAQQISPDEYLAINNSYPFFDQLDGLLRTGPTHTNVMDLRVGLIQPRCF